jgi:biopolymer transport protein ExbD
MGMKFDQQADEAQVMLDINTTPLIDVMLVLLIMLIITIPAQQHAVNLDMPAAQSPAQAAKPVVHKVEIDANSVIRLNGIALASRDDLERAFLALSQEQVQPEIHIRSAAKAKYEAVAAVLASAQRHGLNKLGFAGLEQFAD